MNLSESDLMYLDTPFGRTSRLGIGMATVMRVPSTRDRQRLLDVAVGVGYRHLDVAPLYGLGIAEREVGKLVCRHPEVTIVTKFGITPSVTDRLLAPLQRPARRVIQMSPRVRALARASIPKPAEVKAPNMELLIKSARKSAEMLQVERLDGLVTHEVRWNEAWSDTFGQALRSSLLPTRALGISGSSDLLTQYPENVMANSAIVQSLRGSPTNISPLACNIVYGALSGIQRVDQYLQSAAAEDATLRAYLSAFSDRFSAAAGVIAYIYLTRRPMTVVLVGSTSAEHYLQLWEATGQMLADPPPLSDEQIDLLRQRVDGTDRRPTGPSPRS